MANPLIAQGTLNRLRASVFVVAFPELNVSNGYTGEAGITLSLEGDTTAMIPTMTGMVTSPEPYQMANITMMLLKSQGLSDVYKQRIESNSLIGDVNVTTDSITLGDYLITNCSIASVRELNLAGKDAGYVVTIRGTYNINNDLWGA